MQLYLLENVPEQTFLRWGVNGGGDESYCLFRGKVCAFKTRRQAELVRDSFSGPEDYIIRTFKGVSR